MSNNQGPAERLQPRDEDHRNLDASILSQLEINHGPAGLLGRFFLKAEQAARVRGVYLTFATLEELAIVNRTNSQTWQSILPIFDTGPDSGHDANAFCLLGRDRDGAVVATQAARFFDFEGTTLLEESQSLRLFYPRLDPAQISGRQCIVTGPKAKLITGKVLYSGGAWYRKDFRGRGLSTILPRISRAYGFTLWNSAYTVSFLREALIHNGVAARYGYTNFDWHADLINITSADLHGALGWIDTQQLLDDLSAFLAAEADPIVQLRSA